MLNNSSLQTNHNHDRGNGHEQPGNHARNNDHALTENKRILFLALVVTVMTMIIEVVGGFLSGSLALLADAGHMLTDVAALGLALFAFMLSARPRTAGHTFGWKRFEIFAAFLNGIALWLVAGVIAYDAYLRLKAPHEIKSGMMMSVALIGLVSNLGVGMILFRGRHRHLNVRGAFLHVAADALGSVGVIAAALLIRFSGSFIWDPVVSAAVCLLILRGATRLIRESFHVFMEVAPEHLDVARMKAALREVPGVVGIHDLHVWTITSDFVSLSVHIKVPRGEDSRGVIQRAHEAIVNRFNVLHTTFQIEVADEPGCETGSCPGERMPEEESGPES